jgi:signal transduction histidine kinase
LFRIAARTVLELGSELISSDIIAFYELIKNGFDAGTKNGVEIRFDIVLSRNSFTRLKKRVGDGGNLADLKSLITEEIDLRASQSAKDNFRQAIVAATSNSDLLQILKDAQARFNTITIADSGTGMSSDDLDKCFLVIGTPSRMRELQSALQKGAGKPPYLGEKGIGRLSAMRLGERLRVETARDVDECLNILEIDWRAFGDIDVMLDQIPVQPALGPAKPSPTWSGTSIIVSDLSENWSEARVRDMAEYEFARLTDPFADARSRPRIAIFWNGERKAIPVMPSALLTAAHARLSGAYEVKNGIPSLTVITEALNLGYDHPKEREVLNLSAEDLQSAIWGKDGPSDDSVLLTVGPFSFEAHWYNRRILKGIESIGDQALVRELQKKWSGIMLFRDRFRVFPYGDDSDDWLALDRKAMGRSGYTLNKMQFVGRVSISRTANLELVDQTNREGLRATPEQQVFLEVIQFAVQDRLRALLRDMERQYKNQKIDLSDAKERVTQLEGRAKKAIQRLKRLTPPEGNEAIEDLQQTLAEFTEFAARARKRIAEVEQESQQMIEMAGVGLMIEVVAHELARASENALKALERLREKNIPESLQAQFNTLKAELKTVSKRVRVLDPLSVSGRQRNEVFILDELIRDTIEAHEAQFKRHNITIASEFPAQPVRVRAVKGMVVQILENLISNSVYWLDMRAKRELRFHPKIHITLESGPPTITFEDNGRGIAPENREQVFKPFFSLKDTQHRRGLGLFIARESALHNGGTLVLDEGISPETGRLHRFVLELPEGAQL